MSYKVYKINNKTERKRLVEIENILSFNWQDSIQNVFTSFDFETLEELACGDWIEFYNSDNKETVLIGVITKTSQTSSNRFSYSGYDTGFYLEKNSTIIQFRKQKISKAIADVCKKGDLAVGKLPDINLTLTKIYQNETLSEILKDLYKIAIDKGFDNKYYFDCKDGKVNLLKYSQNEDLRGCIANLYSIKSFDYIKSFEKTNSIENIKTRVELYTSNSANSKSAPQKLYTLTEPDSIKKYGLLNHVEEVDSDKKQDFKTIIKNKLKELNKVEQEISFNVIGDNKLRVGTATTIRNEKININGVYKITSSRHSIKGTAENVEVLVEKY